MVDFKFVNLVIKCFKIYIGVVYCYFIVFVGKIIGGW